MKTILMTLALVLSVVAYAQNDVINKTNTYTGQDERVVLLGENLVEYTRYYSNGQVEETGFVLNGEKHGLWTRYNESGNKQSEMSFFEGARDGVKSVWNEDGHLIFKVKYEMNQVVEAVQYGDNGSVVAAR